MKRLVFLVLLVAAMAGTARGTEIAVVNAERILDQSLPGRKGQEHLKAVQKVLQKGYDDLRELYRGRENTAEAEIWRKKNARYQAVMGRQLFLTVDPRLDFTSAVMREMNRKTPKFPKLPVMTVTKPSSGGKKVASSKPNGGNKSCHGGTEKVKDLTAASPRKTELA